MADQLASSMVRVVGIKATIVLITIVLHPSYKSSSLLLNNNIDGEEFDQPAANPSEASIETSLFIHGFKEDISHIEAPGNHIGLGNLPNLDKRCDESHFLVGKG